jgi:hypothetical protein
MVRLMKTFLMAALGVMLAVVPALAAPPVEAGDKLAPCVGGPNGEDPKADDPKAKDPKAGAPWGVEIAASFDKQKTLDAFARAKDKYSGVLGGYSPTIVEVCDLSMGTELRYSARVDLKDRDAADKLCDKLQAAGGACVVLKN